MLSREELIDVITSTRHVARREEQGLLFVNAQLPKPWMYHLIAGGGQTVWTLHPQSLVMFGNQMESPSITRPSFGGT